MFFFFFFKFKRISGLFLVGIFLLSLIILSAPEAVAASKKGPVKRNGTLYFFNSKGKPAKSGRERKLSYKGKSYYVLRDGRIRKGWNVIGNDLYYFGRKSGVMQKNTVIAGITLLPDEIFQNCYALASVVLPDSLKIISACAFSGCGSLQTIKIPDKLIYIGDSAFEGCRSLEEIHIPDSVESIGTHVFGSCSSLVSVDLSSGIRSIPFRAFARCESLNRIHLPEGIEEIRNEAFDSCENLQSVNIPETVISIEPDAFSNCRRIRLSVNSGSYALQYAQEERIPYAVK